MQMQNVFQKALQVQMLGELLMVEISVLQTLLLLAAVH